MSGSSGISRKVFDSSGALTSNFLYNGSGSPTTSWAAGICSPILLTQLSQGAEDNERIAYSIAIETFDIRIKIVPDSTDAATGAIDQLRILIVADNECDGATPLITEILGDSSQTATTQATGLQMEYLQPAYFGRFRIYRDHQVTWCPSSGATMPQQGESFFHDWHMDMNSHKVVWDMTDSSANPTNCRKGHMWLYFQYERFSTATGGLPTQTLTTPPSILFNFRIRYRDA